jgi:hypothetical protein
MFEIANYAEAGLWTIIGLVLLFASLRLTGQPRRHSLIAAATFISFGASDLVEVQSGAWWRPWWLLIWKASCLAVFGWLLVAQARRRRDSQNDNEC